MSLVGSLEDLGLGDILQIVSLSRKSGVVLLRADARRGRIVLIDGRVCGGRVEGEPASLREVLVEGGFVPEADFKLAADAAAARGIPLEEALAEHTGLATERIELLLREQVEQAVLDMLSWRTGEFSFEVREEVDPRDAELLLPGGLNAQYLAMEATRLGDETHERRGVPTPALPEPSDEEPVFSGEPGAGTPVPVTSPPPGSATEIAVEDTPPATGSSAAALPSEPVVSLVAIDRDLAALEWLKAILDGLFAHIHIFQDAEAGVARVRQYLSRAGRPVVLLGVGGEDGAPGGSLDLLRRLRALAPDMPVVLLHDRCGEALHPHCADGVALRPPTHQLASRQGWPGLDEAARRLREALEPWAARGSAPTARPVPARSAPVRVPEALERLKVVSQRLRDPSTRGEVLSLVLEFAAESFSRVALFMVRDGSAVGMAQRGLAKAGGPDDAILHEISAPLAEPACLRSVIERRACFRGPPADDGDRRLIERLGDATPSEAYVAPIESGGEVAALLYADNLPESRPIGDTTALEILLQEAGLALDRALLERALAQLERGSESPRARA